VRWRIAPPIRNSAADSSILLTDGSWKREMLAEQREYPPARPPIGLVLALPTRDPLEGQAPLDCVRQHRLDLKFEVVLSVGDDFGFIFGAHVEQRQLRLTTLGIALEITLRISAL
jgi:hypothetical protein